MPDAGQEVPAGRQAPTAAPRVAPRPALGGRRPPASRSGSGAAARLWGHRGSLAAPARPGRRRPPGAPPSQHPAASRAQGGRTRPRPGTPRDARRRVGAAPERHTACRSGRRAACSRHPRPRPAGRRAGRRGRPELPPSRPGLPHRPAGTRPGSQAPPSRRGHRLAPETWPSPDRDRRPRSTRRWRHAPPPGSSAQDARDSPCPCGPPRPGSRTGSA